MGYFDDIGILEHAWNHPLLRWREIMKCSNFWLKWFKSKKEVKLIRYLIESFFSFSMHRSVRGFNVSQVTSKGIWPFHVWFVQVPASSTRRASPYFCFQSFKSLNPFQITSMLSFFPQNPCANNPCLNNGICQVGFTTKGYRCVCVPGSAGANCAGIVKFYFQSSFPCSWMFKKHI